MSSLGLTSLGKPERLQQGQPQATKMAGAGAHSLHREPERDESVQHRGKAQTNFSISILFPLLTFHNLSPMLKVEMAHLQPAVFGLLASTGTTSTAKDKGPA